MTTDRRRWADLWSVRRIPWGFVLTLHTMTCHCGTRISHLRYLTKGTCAEHEGTTR